MKCLCHTNRVLHHTYVIYNVMGLETILKLYIFRLIFIFYEINKIDKDDLSYDRSSFYIRKDSL